MFRKRFGFRSPLSSRHFRQQHSTVSLQVETLEDRSVPAYIIDPLLPPIVLLPDLVGVKFSASNHQLHAGDQVDVQFQIGNVGLASAGAFNVSFYLSTDSTITTGDDYLGNYAVGGLFGLSTSATFDKMLTLPAQNNAFWNARGDGSYTLGMLIDVEGNVPDANRSNNGNLGVPFDQDRVQVTNTLAAPAAPVVTGPGTTTAQALPTITWNAVAGATSYELWVDDASTGQLAVIHQTKLAGTSFTPSSPLPLGTYLVWVRASNAAGLVSDWSNAAAFTITPPAPPTVILPAAASVVGTPTLSWAAVPGAASYEVWIYNQNTGGVLDKQVTGTAFTPGNDLPAGTYSVWARSLNAAGQAGDWGSAGSFTILTPAAPTLTGPTDTSWDGLPSITWTNVNGAAGYELYVANGIGGAVIDQQVTGTSFTPAVALATGQYQAWVRARNSSGQFGDWSTAESITVGQLATPTLTGPSGETTNTTPTLSWNAISGAADYELWVDDTTTGQKQVIHSTSLTGTSFTPSSALDVGHYVAWVRALRSDSKKSDWSGAVQFTVVNLPTPAVTGPASQTADTEPAITWTAVTGAVSYELCVQTASGQAILDVPNLTATTYTPSSDLAATTYCVWVRAVRADGKTSFWSAEYDFTIIAPDAPPVQAPVTRGGGNGGSVACGWHDTTGATKYEVWITDMTTGQKVVDQTGLTGTSFTLGNLNQGNYRVWVRAFNNDGLASTWSQGTDFSVGL
jgi:hypothetical protein